MERTIQYRNGFLSLMSELNLVDIYRTLHPNTITYTYETKSQKLKSRIDYFIITKHFINQVKNIEKHDPQLLPIIKLSSLALKLVNLLNVDRVHGNLTTRY